MSFFGSVMTSLAGLETHAAQLSVIGQNLANTNTVGYKERSTNFSTILGEANNNGSNQTSMVKMGTRLNTETTGTIKGTGNGFDMALAGRGFFVVNSAADGTGETFYTRDGSFLPNQQGYMVNKAGMFLQGYDVDRQTADGTTTGAFSSVRIDPAKKFVSGHNTTSVTARVNLPAEDRLDAQNTVPIYDENSSKPNGLVMNWSPVSGEGNQWNLSFSTIGNEGTVDTASAGPITVTFDGNGTVTDPANIDVSVSWADYTDPLTQQTVSRGTDSINFDMSGVRIGGDSFSVYNTVQDGVQLGNFETAEFDSDGVLILGSDSGSYEATHKVAVAMFRSPDSLVELNANTYAVSEGAGAPTYTAVNTDGAGVLRTRSVELSNVDTVDLFTQMIEAQRAYTFTSTALRTADELISIASGMK